jgi:sterol desaturase/sphingolipid hydroxylase (fatty acid hydroxylase superfamily)
MMLHGVLSWVLPTIDTFAGLDILGAFLLMGCVHLWFRGHLLHPNQPLYTNEVKLDFFVHMAGIPLVYLYSAIAAPWEGYIAAHFGGLHSVRTTLAALPWYSQFGVYFMLNEFFSYWRHRAAHWGPFWRFHLVHHANEAISPTNAIRMHPGEVLLNSLKILGLVTILHPNPLVLSLVLYTVGVHALVAHANVNWSFGPLKYIIASPIFHRWHHERGVGKAVNFCESIVLFDVLFGTYHQPADKLPLRPGVPETVPKTVFGILLYPFRNGAGQGVEILAATPEKTPEKKAA